jgi:hypothetical protein
MNLIFEHLKTCHIHLERMEIAFGKVKHLFPFNSEKVEKLNNAEIAFLELFTNRFSKLQDVLGSKIFPQFLDYLGESSEQDTLIDRLNKLEKFRFIESAEEWKNLRKLRNSFSHEYPDNPDYVADNLNKTLKAFDDLKNLLVTIEGKLAK